MGEEIVLVAFASDRGGQGAVRGVAKFNNVNGASALEGTEVWASAPLKI